MKLISIFLLFISIGFSARASSTPPDTTFIRKALTAIKKQDEHALELLRDKITSDDVKALVDLWDINMAWEVKSGFVNVLMDQSGEVTFDLMTDALNAPNV
jgi:hypothetical protein